MSEILNILGSVGLNWYVALATFRNFLIIFLLLKIFFFKKIVGVLRARHQAIERGFEQAGEAEIKLNQEEEEKEVILSNARKERDTIVANAELLGRDIVASVEKDAQAEITFRIEKLDSKEATLRESVEKAFAEQAPALVASLYAKTLAKEMTKEENDALVARMSL